ncbi:tripartite tricarboxylate transporter TctB family protein [Thermodesulfobacteriota bacterium]
MRARGNFYFLLFFLVTMVVAVIMSLGFDYIEAKLLPLLTSSVILLLTITELVTEVLHGRAQTVTNEEAQLKVKSDRETWQFASALGWIIGLLLGVYVVGFLVVIPLFTFSYLKVHGRHWRTSVSFAGIVTIALYLIFELGLRSNLFRGLIFS